MRHGRAVLGLLFLACGGDPSADDRAPGGAPPVDAGTTPTPKATCGDDDTGALPARVARDDAAHTVTLACDRDPKTLAVTAYDDGIVRLRYGDDDRGSIVPIDRPAAQEPLRAGRRGSSVVVCTPAIEIAIEPGTCRAVAKDVVTSTVILDDGADGGLVDGAIVRSSPDSERFYGLGLHTAVAKGLDLRGSTIELYDTDAYDATAGGFPANAPHLYESIPFYAALRGKTAYGVFTDDTHKMRFDLASDGAHVKISGTRFDQYLVAGPALRDVVRRYTRLTGRTPLPPPWAIGFHQSRWEAPCDGSPADRPFCSAAQITSVAQRFHDDGLPLDGIFLDIQHMNGFRSFTFDATRFPDPAAFTAGLEALGVHTSIIIDPGIKVDDTWKVYSEALANGLFLSFEGDVWAGAARFPDFSASRVRTWWSSLVADAASKGIRGAWIDMNEPSSFTTGTVPDATPADGDGRATTMAEVHNAYAWLEAKATYEGLATARPTERPFVLSRAAFAGQQRWSAVWTGDAPSTFGTLAMTLPQLLELGVSGVAFAGSDVGGYSGRDGSNAELFTRWMALGAVSPFFRAHAASDARRQEPWAFGADAEDATRELAGMRYELLPYLYSLFDESSRTGAPILRPLVYEFQDDEKTHAIADEAMLGPFVLAAPLLAAGGKRDVYLPQGRWFELRSGAAYDGGSTITISTDVAGETLPMDALPLFVREGAIIPRTARVTHVADARGGPLWLDVYPGPAPTTFTLTEDDGARDGAFSRVTFTLTKTAAGAHLEASAPEGIYVAKHSEIVVRVRRVDHAGTGGTWDNDDRAMVVTLPDRFPFAIDVAYDATLDANDTVEVPLSVKLPPGTPSDTPIHVASSGSGWTHLPLSRAGDEATGTLRAPRGAFAFFKITRGGWPSVEKGPGCAEVPNRHAFGAATRAVTLAVAAWADRCP
jgi:alpha-glucosidase